MSDNKTIDPIVQELLSNNELVKRFMIAQNQFHEGEKKLIQEIKSYQTRLDTVQRTENIYDNIITTYIFSRS